MIGTLLIGLACRHDKVQEEEDSGPIVTPPTACGPISEERGEAILHFTSKAPQNLLFISIDTLRRDRVGRDDPASNTPFFDALLLTSVVLDDMRSCANWTVPGMICTTVGQTTLDLGLEPLTVLGTAEDLWVLPKDLETLATWLTAAGWQSSLITSSYLYSDAYPIANGFQQYHANYDAPAAWVVDQAVHEIERFKPGQKWYLHLHFHDPHAFYDPPEVYQGRLAGQTIDTYDPRTPEGIAAIMTDHASLSPEDLEAVRRDIDTLYRGEVEYTDAEIARLWLALREEGALDDTLVVITADHGEQNFEHGDFTHARSLQAEEGMIIGAFWATNLEPAVHVNPIGQKDLVPTILDALGVDIPASVTGEVIGTEVPDRVRLSTAANNDERTAHAVERNGLRLLYDWSGQRRFYRYFDDPVESRDLYDSDDADVRCLWDFLRPAIALVDPERAGDPPVHPE